MVVIAICGTPATGKSSLAEKFKVLGFEVIHLGDFVINNKLYQGYDKRRRVYIIDEERLINKIKEIASKYKKIVIEGIGAEILPADIVDLCIVLTCEPFELERRMIDKGFPRKKILENLEAERFGIILLEALDNYGKEKTLIIDTTYRDINEIFDVIIDEIKKRGFEL